MRRGLLVWWLLVGGWVLAIGGGVFGVALPTYQESVTGVLAERVLAETASALNSAPLDATVTNELHVPETLGGAPYRVGIEDNHVYLKAPEHALETTVPLDERAGVTYADSRCRSEEGIKIIGRPAEQTTVISLCGGD